MAATDRSLLAVWGDPIGHSQSPALHAAAYRELGLDWHYDRRQVDAASFADAFAALDSRWRGLSLTMPLKEQAFAAAATRDTHAVLTGAVNTLLLGAEPAGFNTDVGGIIDTLGAHGLTGLSRARVLGAGSTAASAVVAASECGVTLIEVRARRLEQASGLRALGESLGVRVSAVPFDEPADAVDITFATLPTGTDLGAEIATPLGSAGGALFEAAYAPWPSALAAGWPGGPIISGIEMLLHQAVRQVRVFLQSDPTAALPDEERVVAAMRSALR